MQSEYCNGCDWLRTEKDGFQMCEDNRVREMMYGMLGVVQKEISDEFDHGKFLKNIRKVIIKTFPITYTPIKDIWECDRNNDEQGAE
jgi:hypothetical protein